MTTFSYVAVDPKGGESRGSLEVSDQLEAIGRIKQMGLYPVRVLEHKGLKIRREIRIRKGATTLTPKARPRIRGGVKQSALGVFTRQLATLIEAGLPLLRGLKILQEQEENSRLRSVIAGLSESIENGSSLAEAVGAYPKIFSNLYVNMIKAGEIGGALDISLRRLAEFIEKAQRIKGKITAAMFYPCAVLFVAAGILVLLMGFIVPRFKSVFDGLFNGAPLPVFTLFVLRLSEGIQNRIGTIAIGIALLVIVFALIRRTTIGRGALDQLKLKLPVLGPLYRKAAISRFSRTLGTLLGNGVPVLQALLIVRETAANSMFARVISRVHENVKGGDPIAPTLKASGLFPSMVAGMVDVGEQTGALPDMLIKVAETYDEQVDNAASALTSLLEPVMIIFLAVIVGSIVIAMFLPIIRAPGMIEPSSSPGD